MNFINNPLDALTEKKALLEEAPSPKVSFYLCIPRMDDDFESEAQL
jgi:hypothetical protein